jgi:hypothetical protein
MTTIKFREWELIVDKELTKKTFDKIEIGGAESCICDDCKNFVHNRENIYPEEIKILFSELGVDYRKDSEICHYCRQEDGLHFYGGWFHYKGKFIGKVCTIPTGIDGYTLDLTKINNTFSIGFHNNSALTFFEDKENLVQIEFEAKTNWTIEKELENE